MAHKKSEYIRHGQYAHTPDTSRGCQECGYKKKEDPKTELLKAAKDALHLLDTMKDAPTVADRVMHIITAGDILEDVIKKYGDK